MKITEEQALDAICIWEEIMGQLAKGEDELYNWICAPEGAWQGRTNALLLAPLLTAAWQQVQEVFDMDFDWEYVPAALPLFAEKPFAEANTPQHADYVAKRLIRLRMMKEGPKTGAQIPLDF